MTQRPPPNPASTRIAVIGLGYVGLPLAVEFGKRYATTGFDINAVRIAELKQGRDSTLEVEPELMAQATGLRFTDQLDEIAGCNVYIVTVPTPINEHKQPDFTPLIKASESLGRILKPGDTVIYESTVYPGATEEICVPILARVSGLHYEATALSLLPPGEGRGEGRPSPLANTFAIGYSPERINPGDKAHRVTTIKKVTSGSTPATADFVDALYASIITAGTHKAPTIKVAEAAKVIENTQRDANIALMNEFALIFQRLGIDTHDVLEAAGSKWNFLPFKPGLVGGHCIGVDPYYLIQKAQSTGYYPDILLACRRINDAMGKYVADEVVKLMLKRRLPVAGARILILGLTFKENCPDLRNTRVVDLVHEFREYGAQVDVHDPWAGPEEAGHEYGLVPITTPPAATYDAVVLAVGHDQFRQLGGQGVRAFCRPDAGIVYDVKGVLPRDAVDGRL